MSRFLKTRLLFNPTSTPNSSNIPVAIEAVLQPRKSLASLKDKSHLIGKTSEVARSVLLQFSIFFSFEVEAFPFIPLLNTEGIRRGEKISYIKRNSLNLYEIELPNNKPTFVMT